MVCGLMDLQTLVWIIVSVLIAVVWVLVAVALTMVYKMDKQFAQHRAKFNRRFIYVNEKGEHHGNEEDQEA